MVGNDLTEAVVTKQDIKLSYDLLNGTIFATNITLQWRHDERYVISNTSVTIVYSTVYSGIKKPSKLRVFGLCAVNSPVTGEFPAQMVSNAENASFWWCLSSLNITEEWHHSLSTSFVMDIYF